MAVPFVRLSITGTLPGGEVWSVNPAFIGNFETTPPTHAQLQTWATAAASYFYGIDVNDVLMKLLSSAGTIGTIRASYYGADGRLADYAEASEPTETPGVGSLVQSPTAALCISLYTEIPGRQYRGRIYWPALGANLDSTTGRVDTPTVLAAATDGASMLAAMEAACPAGWDAVLAVYSGTRGAGTAVASIRVGNVLDSQRGRKDALVEAYSSTPYPPA
jgi:hypothetical protein